MITFAAQFGAIAQLVEQRTENPCVPGSIPGGTTIARHVSRFFFESSLTNENHQTNIRSIRQDALQQVIETIVGT